MRSKIYGIYLLVFFFSAASFAAQPQPGKKVKKTILPSTSQQSLTFSAPSASISNIGKKLIGFLNKVGVKPASVSVQSANLSSYKTIQPNLSKRLQLPVPSAVKGIVPEKVIWDNNTSTPRYLEFGKQSAVKGKSISSAVDKVTEATNFLSANKSLLNISDPAKEFQVEKSFSDKFGMTHIKFRQVYEGVNVWAQELYVHMDPTGNITSVNGNFEPTPYSITDINGKIASSTAINSAVKTLKNKTGISDLPVKLEKILDYYGPTTKKVIWYDKQQVPHLVWLVEVRSGIANDWYYFVDAQSGNIINSYNNVCYDGATTATGVDLNGVTRTFNTYQIGSNYFMMDASEPMFNSAQSTFPDNPVGAIVNLDLKNQDLTSNSQIYYVTSANNQWSDPASISSHYNAYVTYNYYRTVYNRNSIDDKGMTIYSIIHATENGQSMENAFWSGKVMCYGDGGTIFKPLAGGLDVASHEMTHGVTQYTSNLVYQDQSGALNESMSDCFASLVDSTNWTIGEQVIKDFNTFPSGALRDMSNPHNGGNTGDPSWQPAVMSEYVTTTDDNGGVHVNSGIPNHAFYYVASSIGRAKTGQIWYRAETTYLTRSAQFIDARIATEKAATDLFGSSSSELQAVKTAWDNVQVYEGQGTPPPPSTQLTGAQWVLATNTSSSDYNSIYMAKTQIQTNSDFYALTQTPVLSRPAVSDASGIIIFVDRNYNLRVLDANPNNPQEAVLDSSGVWESVAIGPGLSSLALTSKYIDTTIYYFDLTNQISKKIKITTQSYDAANAKTALYADEMSFDPTGNYLLFDCYNQLKGATGDTISFWNINLLDITTGQISSVFPPLAQGISVGNPSFSKTSPYRFTFDYWNTTSQENYVSAADFNTGQVGTIAGPDYDLGYPTYSADDKIIAYHDVQYLQSAYHDVIEQMPMQSDMITGTNNPQSYMTDATYPFWFVIGTRTTDVKTLPSSIPTDFSLLQNYPNPFNPSTNIEYSINKEEKVTLKVYDVLGNEVATLVNKQESAGNYRVMFSTSNLNLSSGVYFYRLQAGADIVTKKMVLLK